MIISRDTIIPICDLRKRGNSFDRVKFEHARRVIKESNGEVWGWMHPYYSVFRLDKPSLDDKKWDSIIRIMRREIEQGNLNYIEVYRKYIEEVRERLQGNNFPLLLFVGESDFAATMVELEGMQIGSDLCISIPTNDNSCFPAWDWTDKSDYKWPLTKKTFNSLGIKDVRLIGELNATVRASSYSYQNGCVPSAAKYLTKNGFSVEVLTDLTFPGSCFNVKVTRDYNISLEFAE
jgi:hypothetical protein